MRCSLEVLPRIDQTYNYRVCPIIHFGDPHSPLKIWQNSPGPVRAPRYKTNRYPPERLADEYQYKFFLDIDGGGGGDRDTTAYFTARESPVWVLWQIQLKLLQISSYLLFFLFQCLSRQRWWCIGTTSCSKMDEFVDVFDSPPFLDWMKLHFIVKLKLTMIGKLMLRKCSCLMFRKL